MHELENSLSHMAVNAKELTRSLNAQSDVVDHSSSVLHLLLMYLAEKENIYIILIAWILIHKKLKSHLMLNRQYRIRNLLQQAINSLSRIWKNNYYRDRAYQTVADFIKHNRGPR